MITILVYNWKSALSRIINHRFGNTLYSMINIISIELCIFNLIEFF